jgi:hypothetical protein
MLNTSFIRVMLFAVHLYCIFIALFYHLLFIPSEFCETPAFFLLNTLAFRKCFLAFRRVLFLIGTYQGVLGMLCTS